MATSPLIKSFFGGFTALALWVSAVTLSATAFPVIVANAQATKSADFPRFDSRNEPIQQVRAGAAQVSRNDRIVIVVWGGTEDMQKEAYRAVLDLYDQGVPVGFILGPDHDGNRNNALIQIYAASRVQAGASIFINTTNVRQVVVEAAVKIHDDFNNLNNQ